MWFLCRLHSKCACIASHFFPRETLCSSTFYLQNPLNLTLSSTYLEQIQTRRGRGKYWADALWVWRERWPPPAPPEHLPCGHSCYAGVVQQQRNSPPWRSPVPGPQPATRRVLCLHWRSELANHLLPVLLVDLAFYKQQRSMGKVNYPWLVTDNKIIIL